MHDDNNGFPYLIYRGRKALVMAILPLGRHLPDTYFSRRRLLRDALSLHYARTSHIAPLHSSPLVACAGGRPHIERAKALRVLALGPIAARAALVTNTARTNERTNI